MADSAAGLRSGPPRWVWVAVAVIAIALAIFALR
jgi:hypothetical protein